MKRASSLVPCLCQTIRATAVRRSPAWTNRCAASCGDGARGIRRILHSTNVSGSAGYVQRPTRIAYRPASAALKDDPWVHTTVCKARHRPYRLYRLCRPDRAGGSRTKRKRTHLEVSPHVVRPTSAPSMPIVQRHGRRSNRSDRQGHVHRALPQLQRRRPALLHQRR
jgi:hypothetical protein